MCNCIKESEDRLFAHMKSQAAKKQNIKSINKNGSGYDRKAFVFSDPITTKLFLTYEFKFSPVKLNGNVGREKTISQNVFFSYCPFCGKPYPKEEEMKQLDNAEG